MNYESQTTVTFWADNKWGRSDVRLKSRTVRVENVVKRLSQRKSKITLNYTNRSIWTFIFYLAHHASKTMYASNQETLDDGPKQW